MKAKNAALVSLLLVSVNFQSVQAQQCVNLTECEAIRSAQMEERFMNKQIDAFKEHRQTLLVYREEADSYGFIVTVYRDGRVEFTGRPTERGWPSEFATYPYLIPQTSVERIDDLLRKFEFVEMPKRYGARIGLLSHEIIFSLSVKENTNSNGLVRVASGTGYRLPVGFEQLAGEIFRLAEVAKYSCSGIRGFAPCSNDSRLFDRRKH